eukprot:Gb_26956 [translate_table: standard]
MVVQRLWIQWHCSGNVRFQVATTGARRACLPSYRFEGKLGHLCRASQSIEFIRAVSWNTMIVGYARIDRLHGIEHGEESISWQIVVKQLKITLQPHEQVKMNSAFSLCLDWGGFDAIFAATMFLHMSHAKMSPPSELIPDLANNEAVPLCMTSLEKFGPEYGFGLLLFIAKFTLWGSIGALIPLLWCFHKVYSMLGYCLWDCP